MKAIWKDVCLAGIMGLIVPGIVLGAAVSVWDRPGVTEATEVPNSVTEPAAASDRLVVPVLGEDGMVTDMKLEDYLTGVILAEIPVSFEEEARKAQAVVARTYTIRACEGNSKHDNAAVCTDSACCQGFLTEAEYLEMGGNQLAIETMRRAVQDTAGLVLTYQGDLIEATYFSCSGGVTEDAVAVWGTEVPYLQSVSSPGEENATYYTDTVTFSAEEFASALALNLEGNPETWLGSVSYTDGGGVDAMVIGGISFKGTNLRSILGLRSTAFTMTAGEDTITVTTRGYGHRVGMSQYGADAMAVSGSTCAEILAHYYKGTELVQWFD